MNKTNAASTFAKKHLEEKTGLTEFVLLAALLQSLVALSIDAMLPAFPKIGQDLGVTDANDVQLVVMVMFMGFALGQIVYGPLSDSLGRKLPIFIGLVIYLFGSLICIFSESLTMLLNGRFLQGFGIAAPRIVMNAIIRDKFEGRSMARVLSFVMAVFILVPTIAPAIGQGILWLSGWRAIFVMFLLSASTALLWFALRLRETLPAEKRVPLSFRHPMAALVEIMRTRTALCYTICIGLVFSPFIAYLSTAQQVFVGVYGQVELFPAYFAIVALSIGTASLLNSRLVLTFGMYSLAFWSICVLTVLSLGFTVLLQTILPKPPLWGFMVFLIPAFFCLGLVFGNLNALAMQPLGHIAGVGASVIGFLSMLISIPAGIVIGRAFDGTVVPLVTGFGVFGFLVGAVMHWTKRKSSIPSLFTPVQEKRD